MGQQSERERAAVQKKVVNEVANTEMAPTPLVGVVNPEYQWFHLTCCFSNQ